MKKGNWSGGWRIPSEKELAKRKRLKELRSNRQSKALTILATLKKADAITIIVGLKNWSRVEATTWIEQHRGE